MAPLRIVGDPAYPQIPHARTTPGGSTECPPFVGRRFGQKMPLGGGWGLRMSRPRTRAARAATSRARAGPSVSSGCIPGRSTTTRREVRLPAGKQFAHYFRLGNFATRFAAILKGATFGPLGPIVQSR